MSGTFMRFQTGAIHSLNYWLNNEKKTWAMISEPTAPVYSVQMDVKRKVSSHKAYIDSMKHFVLFRREITKLNLYILQHFAKIGNVDKIRSLREKFREIPGCRPSGNSTQCS